MSNNTQCEIVRKEINMLEEQVKMTNDPYRKLELLEELLAKRQEYTPLLLKKRPLLLGFAIGFAVFWCISLAACLPPYIIRGKKRDINEEKIVEIKYAIRSLKEGLGINY